MNEYNERILKNALEDLFEEKDKEYIKEIEEANNDSRFARTPEKKVAFEKFMNKEMKKAERKANAKKNLIRVASVFLAICLGFTVMTVSVQGFKEKVWNFFANLGSQTHFSMNASTDENVKLLETYEGKYIPSWIPDGYKIDNVENHTGMHLIEMSNNKNILSYTENDIDGILGIDNEQIEIYKEITIKGEKAIKAEKDGTFYLTLKKDKCLIYIMTTDKELDLIGFAELIEKK